MITANKDAVRLRLRRGHELAAVGRRSRLRPPRRSSGPLLQDVHALSRRSRCCCQLAGSYRSRLSSTNPRVPPPREYRLDDVRRQQREPQIRLTSSRKMFSRSESSVTAVLRCLFPRSRKRRHFGDDLGWHLNLGFFFLIWRPVNFRHLR